MHLGNLIFNLKANKTYRYQIVGLQHTQSLVCYKLIDDRFGGNYACHLFTVFPWDTDQPRQRYQQFGEQQFERDALIAHQMGQIDYDPIEKGHKRDKRNNVGRYAEHNGQR